MSDDPGGQRVSRFHEHTNTTTSIRPPPAELWKDAAIDGLMDRFNDENDSTPAASQASHPRRIMSPTGVRARTTAAATTTRKGSDAAATVATAEGTFGRFSRVFAQVFGGVLGKRKAGHADAEPAGASSSSSSSEQAVLDERKRQAEEAYHLAKEQGLLPAPKVFVRPGMTPRAWSADTPSRPRPPLTPRTPGSVVRSPSKKDLNKQKRLSKRVSSLEVKLASAKKELQSVLGNECFPAVPPLPQHIPGLHASTTTSPTPNAPLLLSDDGDAPLSPTRAFADATSASLPGKITKKRKTAGRVHAAVEVDDESPSLPTGTAIASDGSLSDAEGDAEAEAEAEAEPRTKRTIKRVKSNASTRLHRTSSRLTRKLSRSSVVADEADDKVVTVQPGGAVPPVPAVPSDVAAKTKKKSTELEHGANTIDANANANADADADADDGYGGLGHEIF